MKWWTYFNSEIELSSDFIPYDESKKRIVKEAFLRCLMQGQFIPIKLETKDSMDHYQLVKLNQLADERVVKTIKNQASIAYRNFKLENIKFPEFNFVDINGNVFSTSNAQNKLKIVKCWFIKCKACVDEFEVLNEFYSKYHPNGNIVFMSLALDSKEALVPFLVNKPFKFPVIPNQKEFLNDILKVTIYPTHYIIDGEGLIKKVVNSAEELIDYFENNHSIIQKKKSDSLALSLPPPPIVK